MKAITIHRFGGPEVLHYEETPTPTIAPGEVLVKVQAIGVNPVDWKTRAGHGVRPEEERFPLILGWDISGVVAASAAPDFQPGAEVFGMVRFPAFGAAYAEYVAAPAAHLAHKPPNISHAEAAATPLAALTAWQALFEAGNLQPGQRVLIPGAAGGVGHLAVQLAKWQGATVIGTASAHNRAYLESLAVDQVADYTPPGFAEAIAPVDLVFDTVGGATTAQLYRFLKPGGALVSILHQADPTAAAAVGATATNILVRPVAEHLAAIATLLATGRLKTVIAAVFPLHEAHKAHELSESRHARGKIVLQPTHN